MFEAYALYASGPAAGTSGYRYLPIYVHAKVAIIDDEWIMIGSANLNRRGLATDTEIAVQAVDPQIARSLRVDLWSEHLGLDPAVIDRTKPAELIDTEWKSRSARLQRAMGGSDVPPAIHALRYVAGGTPQSRLMDRLQSMTLEH
jgi:phosphatidylserine/phosphatidylglycerophosphate/cardiolipin synthase-like enzyme